MESLPIGEDHERNNTVDITIIQALLAAIINNKPHYPKADLIQRRISPANRPGKVIICIPLPYILYLFLNDCVDGIHKDRKIKKAQQKLTRLISDFLSKYSQYELIEAFKKSPYSCVLMQRGTSPKYEFIKRSSTSVFTLFDPEAYSSDPFFSSLRTGIKVLDTPIKNTIKDILCQYQGLQATPSNQKFLPHPDGDGPEESPVESLESPDRANTEKENDPEHRYRTIIRLIHDVEGRYVENLQAEKDKDSESKRNFYYSIYVPDAKKLILVSSGIGSTFICHNVDEGNISEYQTKTKQELEEDAQVNSFTWKEGENLKTTFEAQYKAPTAKQETVRFLDTFEASNPSHVKAALGAFVTAYNAANPSQHYTVFDLRPETKMPVMDDKVRHSPKIKIGDNPLSLGKFFRLMCNYLGLKTSDKTRQEQKTRVRKNIVEPILKYAGFTILNKEYFENAENVQADLRSIFALLFPGEEWNDATSLTRIRISMNAHRVIPGVSKKFRATNGQDISPELYRTRYENAMGRDLLPNPTPTSPR